MEAVKDKINQLLKEKFSEEDFGDCFVVDITISKSNRVQVYVDCESGVNLVTCTKLSRHLEAWLDESLTLGAKYTLEVSSPGVDRPLIKRQYPKNVGRKIKVKTKDGQITKGVLLVVKEEFIKIEVPKGKKEVKEIEIGFGEIEESKIIVSF